MTTPTPDPHYALTFSPVAESDTPPAPTPATIEPPMQLLYVPPLYTYAYAPGVFVRHEGPDEFDTGQTAKLWGARETALEVDEATKDVIKDLCLRGVPKADDPGGTPPVEGGARVGRGYVYLDEFPGGTPADQLRNAVSSTNQAIVPMPGTVIDVGNSPIVMPARKVIAGLGGPQNEFKGTWPVYFRGSGAAIRNAPVGTNYGGNKGWGLENICLVGQPGLAMIEQVTAANQLDYLSFDGCSFDTWNYVLDGPTLGVHIGGNCYTNNIYGSFAYRFKGSDSQLFMDGGKLDFGGAGNNPNATNIIFSLKEKSTIGPLYITGAPARCVLIEGGYDRAGLTFLGTVMEGRNVGNQSAGAVLAVTGADATFVGCQFNFSKAGRDQGIVNVSGGSASFIGCRWRRAANYGPEIYQSGGVVDVSGARLIDPAQPPRQIDYHKAGGTLLSDDGTVRMV